MKKHAYRKRLLALVLGGAMALSLTACGGGGQETTAPSGSTAPETESVETTPVDTSVSYKGNVSYVDIAEQLRADTTLDLDGLSSEKFKITGYAQGYDFNEAWIGSLTQMVNSGCQVVLASGSSQFAFNFGGLPRTAEETDIRVGGVDSLTAEFSALLEGGVYDFCSGSYPSMVGPAIALTLRALEGNPLKDADGNAAAVPMDHLIVHNPDEMNAVLAEDTAGNYAYNAGVISTLMSADYDTFMEMVSNADWEQIKSVKDAHSGDAVATLSKDYKIGILRNDVTSDEALAYESYISEIADAMGFTVTFSESTEANATNEVNQIQTWAAAGYDAVISISNGSVYDQAETCESNGLMYALFAFHPEDDDLPDLQALNNYLGSVGASKYNEAQVGYRMAKYYIDQGYTDFAIFGGSIMFGAEQHAYRVAGMLAAMIENETGVPCADFQ